MHPRPRETERVFVDCEGPDDKALADAFRWLVQEVERRQLPGVIVTYAKSNAENLSRVLGERGAAALIAGRSLPVKTQTVSLVTVTKRLPYSLRGSVVLSVWLDDKHLSALDDAQPAAICAVPWIPDSIQKWRRSWNPRELRKGLPSAPEVAIDNAVVIEALQSLTVSVNLSTGLSHPSDRDDAIHTFRALRHGREAYDPAAVRAWAVQNGWSATGADELQEIAQGVLEGKRFRTREPAGRSSESLAYWRKRARGAI
jgi:hypothetical protein